MTDLGLRAYLSTERCEWRLTAEQPLVVCRGSAHEMCLSDPAVTRSMAGVARFVLQGEQLLLEPLVSDCAILVNGERIRETVPVNQGDRIRIGYTVIVLQQVESSAGETEVRTVRVRTDMAQQRNALANEAERLAQWADCFEAVKQAATDEDLARLVLPQLARLADTEHALICQASTDSRLRAFRELASSGYHGNEVEAILHWCGQHPLVEGPSAPVIREITGRTTAQRAAVGCLEIDGLRWVFILEPPALASAQALAQRGLSLLSNLLLLFQTLHGGQAQKRLVNELSETVRSYAQPLDEAQFQIVRERFGFRSGRMQIVCRQLARAAAASCPVLILGERGTGKQVAADAIHAASARRHKTMISVSLAESNEELIEADLFGTVKGAFNGAVNKKGLLEAAHDSTLFLDEIGEISPAVQTKLLRVLDRGEFRRVGDAALTRVNVRIILATNRDLAEEVRRGRFRADLYDRINVIPIRMAPLRERMEDLPLLVEEFLQQSNTRNDRRVQLTPSAIQHLQRYTWPENVRGLQNYLERAVVMEDRGQVVLGPDDLPPLGSEELAPSAEDQELRSLVEELQRMGKTNQARILRLMQSTPERLPKTEFANRLQISRPVLRAELRKLVSFGLDAGLDREFFESRIVMRPEDWAEIEKSQN